MAFGLNSSVAAQNNQEVLKRGMVTSWQCAGSVGGGEIDFVFLLLSLSVSCRVPNISINYFSSTAGSLKFLSSCFEAFSLLCKEVLNCLSIKSSGILYG